MLSTTVTENRSDVIEKNGKFVIYVGERSDPRPPSS